MDAIVSFLALSAVSSKFNQSIYSSKMFNTNSSNSLVGKVS